jgi:F-type H+-transporting ATPase subunit delta
VSVATIYAEALYEAAVDADAAEQVASDLSAFAEAVESSPELRSVLDNPEVDTRARKGIVATLTEDAHPVVANFLQVLIDRHRIGDLEEIVEAFRDRVARAQHRLEVEAVTAVPLPDDLRERIVKRLKEKTGSTVDLTESVDPDIVGGLVLNVGGKVVDGSVRHRIDELREALRHTPVDAAATAS